MSIAGDCTKHNIPNVMQDVGRGKWVPVCPKCEHERKAALAEAFWSVGSPKDSDVCQCGHTRRNHLSQCDDGCPCRMFVSQIL